MSSVAQNPAENNQHLGTKYRPNFMFVYFI